MKPFVWILLQDYGAQNLDKVMTQDCIVTKNIWQNVFKKNWSDCQLR